MSVSDDGASTPSRFLLGSLSVHDDVGLVASEYRPVVVCTSTLICRVLAHRFAARSTQPRRVSPKSGDERADFIDALDVAIEIAEIDEERKKQDRVTEETSPVGRDAAPSSQRAADMLGVERRGLDMEIGVMSRLIDFYRTQARILWEWRGGRWALFKRLVITLLVSTVAFLLTAAILPGITIGRPLDAVVAVVFMTLFNALVRPVLLVLVAPRSLLLLAVLVLVLQVATFLVIAPLARGVHGRWVRLCADRFVRVRRRSTRR